MKQAQKVDMLTSLLTIVSQNCIFSSFLAKIAKMIKICSLSQFLSHCCEIGSYDINFFCLLHSSAAIWQQLFHIDRFCKIISQKATQFFLKIFIFRKIGVFGAPPQRGHMGCMVNLRFFIISLTTQLLNTFKILKISFRRKKL